MTWGRLTLESGKARMGENVSSSTLYYTPFESSGHNEVSISISGIVQGNLYDVYIDTSNDALSLTSAWTNNTTPSTARTKTGGLWFDSNGKLYLGTIYASSNGICKWQTRPNAAAYGATCFLGVFNAYNRLPVTAISRNSNTSWDYGSSGLRYADNSVHWRIWWVDGLGDVSCEGKFQCSVAGYNTNPAAATIGVGLDQDSYPINWDGSLHQAAVNHTALGGFLEGRNWTNGLIGLHNWQAMEQSTSEPITFYGNNFACLTLTASL